MAQITRNQLKKEDSHSFQKHLKESQNTVWLVAQWLCKKGYHIQIGPNGGLFPKKTGAAESHKDFIKHQDSGDLYISQRVEIKGLSANFTSAEDWPFDGFIVCAKHSWDYADPKPYVYFIVNNNRTHMAIVKGDTSSKWTVREKKDKRYHLMEQKFYYCPLDLIKWIEI